MHSTYRSPVIRQLRDQQVRFAPRSRKLEQVERAEQLLCEIEPSKTYSYEYLCFRITDYRPDSATVLTMTGESARHDVRLFVEDVSEAAEIRASDYAEPVHTVESLSRMFNVSPKTISRWRDRGLVGRRFIFESGRRRVGFLQSSVDRFVAENTDRVSRGERFSHLSADERRQIIERAHRLARAGAGQSEVARRIAKRMNRSVEAIRYTLKEFDLKYPHVAVFPRNDGPLTEEVKAEVYREHRRGRPVSELSRRFGRTRTSIYRIVNEMRARRMLDLPLDHVFNDEFELPEAESVILAALPDGQRDTRMPRIPQGLPPYLASLYEVPLLTREQEAHLFRKYNYLKYRASKLREGLVPAKATNKLMDQIDRLYEQAIKTKNRIVQSNLRLVVSIAKRHVTVAEDFFGLVSDGNISLMRAVEKFDYSRGNKFSTYATWAVMRNFARTIPGEFKYRERYKTSQDELFTSQEDDRAVPYVLENAQHLRKHQVERILTRLDEREQTIIISRFGLDHTQEPKTLKEVGSELGVTKERIRQIEARALSKLRIAAEEEKIELPD
jgi:RNA polymerase primary sigma factor/RNA polymerase sigma factor